MVYPAPNKSLCVEINWFLLAFEPSPVTAMAERVLELSALDAGGGAATPNTLSVSLAPSSPKNATMALMALSGSPAFPTLRVSSPAPPKTMTWVLASTPVTRNESSSGLSLSNNVVPPLVVVLK